MGKGLRPSVKQELAVPKRFLRRFRGMRFACSGPVVSKGDLRNVRGRSSAVRVAATPLLHPDRERERYTGMTDMQRRRGKAHDRSSVAWTRRAGRVHGRALAGSGGIACRGRACAGVPLVRPRATRRADARVHEAVGSAHRRSQRHRPRGLRRVSGRYAAGRGMGSRAQGERGGSGEQHAHVRRRPHHLAGCRRHLGGRPGTADSEHGVSGRAVGSVRPDRPR